MQECKTARSQYHLPFSILATYTKVPCAMCHPVTGSKMCETPLTQFQQSYFTLRMIWHCIACIEIKQVLRNREERLKPSLLFPPFQESSPHSLPLSQMRRGEWRDGGTPLLPILPIVVHLPRSLHRHLDGRHHSCPQALTSPPSEGNGTQILDFSCTTHLWWWEQYVSSSSKARRREKKRRQGRIRRLQ